MTRRSGDDLLVRRTERSYALQTAALVALAMLGLVIMVTVTVVRGQARTADGVLRSAVATADDVGDPPAGSWVVIERGGHDTATVGLPGELAAALQVLRDKATRTVTLADVAGEDQPFRAATQRRDGRTVQVVSDLTGQQQQRTVLLRAMGVACLLSLFVSLGLGALVGRRAVRPLAAALVLQRTFVADASHELRTPLTLLTTRAQVLDRSLVASGADTQLLADCAGVVDDARRLGDVVDDLLVAAASGRSHEGERIDMAGTVESAAESARAHAARTHVTVTVTTRSSDDGGCWVLGSAAGLRRALLALLDNAIDHTPAGGEVTVLVARAGGDVLVRIADSGEGVSAQDAPHVFQRFRSGGHRSGRAHYGLGLALSREVADRHGGALRLGSSATGAAFELVLPAVGSQKPPRKRGHR